MKRGQVGKEETLLLSLSIELDLLLLIFSISFELDFSFSVELDLSFSVGLDLLLSFYVFNFVVVFGAWFVFV